MKKQMKISKKKLLLIIGGILALIAAAVAAFMIFGSSEARDKSSVDIGDRKLYWNIDRLQYVGSDSNPMPQVSSRHDRDGIYYLRMAVDGEQVEVQTKDIQLVQQMDNWDLMCLSFDEEGYVTEVIPTSKWSQKVLEDVYVQSIDGQTVTVNSNAYYTALEQEISVTEDTLVYNVANYDGSGLLTGHAGTLSLDDQITVVLDKNGTATHVFTEPYRTPGTLYYSTERLYDSGSKMTTRISDVLGYYNYDFMVDGKLVNLRTRDMAVASKIDQQPYQWVGLEFDENGDIIAANSGGVTVYGKGACLNSTVQSVQWDDYGATIKCIYPSSGKTTRGRLHPDCKIYDYSGEGEFGQLTQLREGDYIRALRDHRGRIIYIAVVYRPGVYQHAYILNRQYDSKAKTTLRQPDTDGYYHIQASVGGKTVNLRCNKLNTVTYIDSQGTNIVGLQLQGDEILRAVPATYTLAGYYLASGWDLTAIDKENGTIEVTSMSGDTKGTVKTGTLAANCVVYNVSLMANTVGQTDQVSVGDTVRAYTNYKGEVEVIYVTKRPMESPAYRKIKDLGKQSDGYYHYLMAVNGKQITVKANGDARTQIEKSKTLGLLMNAQNVVYKSVSAVNVAGYNGGVFASDYTVTGCSGTLTVAKGSDVLSAPMAKNCEIYNLTAYGSFTGEVTKLRIGDKIQCFKNKAGEITLIYVTERATHTVKNHCACYGSEYQTNHSSCKKLTWTKLPEAVDNKIVIKKSGNYYLTHNAAGMLIVEPGLKVNLCLNGYLLRARQALTAREGAVVNITDCDTKGCISGTHDTNGGYAVKVSGGTVNLYSGILDGVQPFNAKQKNRCVLVESGDFNMYGGTIRDGYVTDKKNGGNVLVLKGQFTMLGGKIVGGQVAEGQGSDVYISADAVMTLGGTAQAGKVYLATNSTLDFHKSLNVSKASASIDMDQVSARFGVGSSVEAYTKAITATDSQHMVAFDAEQNALYLKSKIPHIHCVCVGSDYVADHSGCTLVNWEPVPIPVDNKITITKSGSYYLIKNTAAAVTIEPGVNVDLCLNGFNLQARQAISVLEGATLNLSDCTGNGCVSSTKEDNGGYALKVSGGTANFYSGTLNGVLPTNAERQNRCVLLASGQFNMYGGKIVAGYLKDSKNGGNVLAQSGNFTMLGGMITGGQVTNGKGADVYMDGDATMVFGGKAQAGEVYLAKKANLTFHESLDSTKASMKLTLADTQAMIGAGTAKAEYTQAIISADSTYATAYDSTQQALYLNPQVGHIHCLCNADSQHCTHRNTLFTIGLTQEMFDNAAQSGIVTRTEYTHERSKEVRTAYTLASGCYYLAEDVTLDAEIFLKNKDVTLCLNGYTLSSEQSVFVLYNASSRLNITDHENKGVMTGKGIAGQEGGLIWAYNEKAAISIYGGQLTLHKEHHTIPYGGVISTQGPVYIYDGILTGGEVTTHGGCIRLSANANAVVTMYDGIIQGGSAKEGGNIASRATDTTKSSLYLLGGIIRDGSSAVGADVQAGGVIVVGNVQIGEVYLADGVSMALDQSFNPAKASIGVKAADVNDPVATGLTQEQSEAFFAADETKEPYYESNALYLIDKKHRHCICVGSEHISNHSFCESVVWVEAPAKTNNKITITESGHYYLTQTEAATLVINSGLTVELCLNGFDLYGSTPITVGQNVNLSICDHTGNGRVYSSKTDASGYAVKVDGGTFNLYSGMLRGLNKDNQRPNRPVQITAGQFNMYGGAICDGTAKSGENGGNILINGGDFTMYGGTISGGSTTKHGGNICIQNGTFTMKNGIITGGVAGNKGGNVMLLADAKNKTAQFILENGTVSGGLTEEDTVNAQNGGNICVNATTGISKFTMYGGSVIGGQVSQKGANVFVYKSDGSEIELVTGIELADVYLDTGKEITVIEPK